MAPMSGLPLHLRQQLFLSPGQHLGLEMGMFRLFPGMLIFKMLTVEVEAEKWEKDVPA